MRDKLEVLREDVQKICPSSSKDRVVAVRPLPEQRLHLPVSFVPRDGHVTTGECEQELMGCEHSGARQ